MLLSRCHPYRARGEPHDPGAEPRIRVQGQTCQGRCLSVIAAPRPGPDRAPDYVLEKDRRVPERSQEIRDVAIAAENPCDLYSSRDRPVEDDVLANWET